MKWILYTFQLIRSLLINLTAKSKVPLTRHIVNLLLSFLFTENQTTNLERQKPKSLKNNKTYQTKTKLGFQNRNIKFLSQPRNKII